MRAVGLGIQELLPVPVVWMAYQVRVRGEENLKGLEGPVIFAPNHCLHTDNMIILIHLPLIWRWRLSIAAAADDIFGNPLRGLVRPSSATRFHWPRGRGAPFARAAGARLDRQFSILIYPEGELTVGGPLKPFKAGIGLVAVEGATPVVPMKLRSTGCRGSTAAGRAPRRAATSRSCSASRFFSRPAPTTPRRPLAWKKPSRRSRRRRPSV